MATVQFQSNQIIVSEGQSLTHLYLILKGSVEVSFPGGSFIIGKGDVIGICEAATDLHLFTYTALEETTTANYSYSGIDTLEYWFQAKSDLAGLFCLSISKQIAFLLQKYSMMAFEYSMLYPTCQDDYESYRSLCKKHMISPISLNAVSELEPLNDEQPIEEWLMSYYEGLHQFFHTGGAALITKASSATAAGLIGKTALDALIITEACRNLYEYRSTYFQIYLNESGEDMFALYTALYFRLPQNHSDRKVLYTGLSRMLLDLQSEDYPNPKYASGRIDAFMKQLQKDAPVVSVEDFTELEPDNSEATYITYLADSLDTILTYSDTDTEFKINFKEDVTAYRQLSDPLSTESKVTALRKRLTESFYVLYEDIFLKTLDKREIPIPVKLFLYFGYVDENLAGSQNLASLYSIAASIEENLMPGVYTLYHWLKAIYRGEKEPSRNQYDEDYTDHIHSVKAAKKLTDAQVKQLLADQMGKVKYELKSMFPVVNKMTCGRISTYCPLFSEHNAIKPLNSCLVTSAALKHTLEKIREIDFSAFYREMLYTNEAGGVPREFIHVECLPDFILMPNIGTRGVMWQEIEGRKRTTPCRMLLSIFQLEDLNHILVRLTGEYRWEMCKRIQGARWNDVSERSLTSEYFDYIQFYRKNHELSSEAKEKIKNSLQKARNNFKEMFIMDYMIWILYEGNGSPRMNKIARQILFTYCPFKQNLRESLSGNPIYKELADRYAVQQKRRVHHIEMVIQKLSTSGQMVPSEINNEKNFILM